MKRRLIISLVALLPLALAALFYWNFLHEMHVVETRWQTTRVTAFGDIGSTRRLRIVPLVDWHAARSELRTEAGVSYLIETDHARILFDVGHNAGLETTSPLQHNMQKLGFDLSSFDSIFISHLHFDHVGGTAFARERTFSLGLQPVDLSAKEIYVPVAMQYPGAQPRVTAQPTVLAPGVATIGTIERRLFMGPIEEQALAIHVHGHGVVLIVGCGHQTVPKIIERSQQLFGDTPIYGIVGGLHYPVPDGRMNLLGLNLQRIFASGDGPLAMLSHDDLLNDIRLLQSLRPGLVSVGGHDSSDAAIAEFRQAFGTAYRDLLVGAEIVVGR